MDGFRTAYAADLTVGDFVRFVTESVAGFTPDNQPIIARTEWVGLVTSTVRFLNAGTSPAIRLAISGTDRVFNVGANFHVDIID